MDMYLFRLIATEAAANILANTVHVITLNDTNWSQEPDNDLPRICIGGNKIFQITMLIRCSAIAEKPRCRVRYSFGQK